MDAVGLATLAGELKADCRVASDAVATARERLKEGTTSGFEGCAHHLARFYNVIEKTALRVATAFENQVDRGGGWHAEVLRRMAIDIPGVRPALWSDDVVQSLRELCGFRHVFTHAYDLQFDPEKLALLIKHAGRVAPELPGLCSRFLAASARMHGIEPPPQ